MTAVEVVNLRTGWGLLSVVVLAGIRPVLTGLLHQGLCIRAACVFSWALVIDCDSFPVLYFTLTSWHAFLGCEWPQGWTEFYCLGIRLVRNLNIVLLSLVVQQNSNRGNSQGKVLHNQTLCYKINFWFLFFFLRRLVLVWLF